MRRIGFGWGAIWQIDFFKVSVLHTPENVAPGSVQGLHIVVMSPQPLSKARPCSGRIRERGVVTPVLVVELPSLNGGVCTHCLGKVGHDMPASVTVTLVRETIVAARAKRSGESVLIKCDHVRHRIYQPLGWGCGGRADHHRESFCFGEVEKPLEPGKFKFFRLRLETAPGEFGHADVPDP